MNEIHSSANDRLEEEEEKDDKPANKPPENLDTKLLESRTILVEGVVNDRMYRAVCSRLLYLEHKDPTKEVVVVVNSPGGSADSGMGMYDMLNLIACPVTTLCAGLCASAGVLIFLGGRKGRRFATPNSRFLLHQPSTQATGQASDMEITAREIIRMRQRYADIVGIETGKLAKTVLEGSNRDFWLNADECLEYGLIDRIVKRRSEL